jgi:hypothetical protein
VLLAACGGREITQSDWERQNQGKLGRDEAEKEVVIRLPDFPRKANLIEFAVGKESDFAFFVDKSTLSVASDGLVRYVMLARSPSGVENVSYEGLRCESAEVRRFALGRPDGTWHASPGPLQPVRQPWHEVLFKEYFCSQKVPIRNAAEGVRALEQGGHPAHRGFAAEPNAANPNRPR